MERYEELKLIGKGNFGSCYLVRDKGSGARVVVKKVAMTTLSAKERADSEMECQLLMPVLRRRSAAHRTERAAAAAAAAAAAPQPSSVESSSIE